MTRSTPNVLKLHLRNGPIEIDPTDPAEVLTTRPTSFAYRCVHCGTLHRAGIEHLGRVIPTACGRGHVRVALTVADSSTRD